MVWLPAARAEVLNVAVPELIAPVPRVTSPFLKVTVPVAPLVTVAVKVTVSPAVLGLAELTSVVVDAAWLTVCVNVLLVLVA
jgi:hypothetical protein